MKRYISKPKQYWEEGEWVDNDPSPHSTIAAIESEREREEFTGLYDHDGNKVYRVNDFKMGFIW